MHSLEELRRLLAQELYGTKQYLKKGEWEVPFLQAFLDKDNLIDLCARSEVIDVNKSHHRNKVYASIGK